MAPRPALNLEQAIQMKADIWEGMSNGDVANRHGISALTISLVRNGKAYQDTPWPDGSSGTLSEMQRDKMSRAKRRDTVSGQAPARSHYAPGEEQRLLDILFEDKGKRFISMEQARLYFLEQIREEDRVAKLAKYEAEKAYRASPEGQAAWAELQSRHPPREVTRDDIINPETNDRLDWDYILEVGGDVPMVEVANEGNDPALKEAIRIAFKLIGPRQWKQDHMLKLVYSIKAKIERYWEEFGGAPEIETNCFKTSPEPLLQGK